MEPPTPFDRSAAAPYSFGRPDFTRLLKTLNALCGAKPRKVQITSAKLLSMRRNAWAEYARMEKVIAADIPIPAQSNGWWNNAERNPSMMPVSGFRASAQRHLSGTRLAG